MPSRNVRKASTNTTYGSIEKPSEGAWITSGDFGSRDAVLVFRTNILNPEDKKSLLEKMSPLSLTASNSNLKVVSSKDAVSLHESDSLLSCVSCDSTDAVIASPPSTSKRMYRSRTANTVEHVLKEISSADSEESPSLVLDEIKMCVSAEESWNVKLKMKVGPLNLNSAENDSQLPIDNSVESECNEAEKVYGKPYLENVSGSNDDIEEGDANYNTSDADELSGYENGKDEHNDLDILCEDFDLYPYADNMPAIQLKITYKFMQTETKLLRRIFARHGLSEVDGDESFSILWTGIHLKPDILRNLAPYQRVNHFPRSYELTRKDRLYKNIERMQHLRGTKHFDIVPQSFVLPLEYKDLVSAHNKHRGPWIVKPAASSRGRGIFIVNAPDQIPQDEQLLVSKYVVDPLCIDGHKCDLRVYVLVTSFDPLIVYIYEEGLVRLATVKYDRSVENLWNPCMHLCNYSINKYHTDYIKSSDAHDEDVGHKWTLSALLRHLKSQGCDTRHIMTNIEELVIKSLLSCAQSIISACRMFVPNGNNCFELYGFDILIDDTLKPWLLEINLSPSMGVDSPLDAKVKACLIADLLTCVGIPAYSPAMRAHYDSKWSRFRNVGCMRRTSSADRVGNINAAGSRRTSSNGVSALSGLSSEEQRIIRNAQLQNARRGGFVRIFPTEDTMQRYGNFLDPSTGIPLSTPVAQGQASYSMILSHNYNHMLFQNLYGKNSSDYGAKEENSQDDRMYQYERILEKALPLSFDKKIIEPKCAEEGTRLGKHIIKLIRNGSELTQLQARQVFALYLESILRRLTQEPKDYHEKLILKFLNRVGGAIKAPVFFRNPQNLRVVSKARSAMVAKLLGDFLEQYIRDTDAYVDSFDHFGMIPSNLFSEFISQAEESDLEAVLVMHTNFTGTMPYLYNRYGMSVPPTPPIPSGDYGFLKALPTMVLSGSAARDFNKYDGYYKSTDKDLAGSMFETSSPDPNKRGSMKR